MEGFSRTRNQKDKLCFTSEYSKKNPMYQHKPAAFCKPEKVLHKPAEHMEVSKSYKKSSSNPYEDPINDTTMYRMDCKGLPEKTAKLSKPGISIKRTNTSFNRSAECECKYNILPNIPSPKSPVYAIQEDNVFQLDSPMKSCRPRLGVPIHQKKYKPLPNIPSVVKPNLDLLTVSDDSEEMPKIQPTASNKQKSFTTTAEPFKAGFTSKEAFQAWKCKSPVVMELKEKDCIPLCPSSMKSCRPRHGVPTHLQKYKPLPNISSVVKPNLDLLTVSDDSDEMPKIQPTGLKKLKCLTTSTKPVNAVSTSKEPVLMELKEKGCIPFRPLQKKTPFPLAFVPQPPPYSRK